MVLRSCRNLAPNRIGNQLAAALWSEHRMSQKVLVTAGAQGIGREIVRAFVAAGAQVAVCDIDEPGLETLRSECPGVITLVCDVGQRDAV